VLPTCAFLLRSPSYNIEFIFSYEKMYEASGNDAMRNEITELLFLGSVLALLPNFSLYEND